MKSLISRRRRKKLIKALIPLGVVIAIYLGLSILMALGDFIGKGIDGSLDYEEAKVREHKAWMEEMTSYE